MPSSRLIYHHRSARIFDAESEGVHRERHGDGSDATGYLPARPSLRTAARWRARPALLPVILSAVVLLTGCTSARVSTSTSYGTTAGVQTVSTTAVETTLRAHVERWEGTPHALGGVSESGMDCSAFVQRVFADAFRLDLPRTTEEQVEQGRRVNMSELQPGDLVFFQPPTKTNHVGIYLNEGEFAHVSTSAGVMVSEIDEPYWRGSYWTSRRVLAGDLSRTTQSVIEPRMVQPAIEDPGTSERARDRTRRVGW